MSTPTDPLFPQQWHFGLIGDIEAIWDDYTGAGISLGLYDDGVQFDHPELAPNYDASLHVVNGSGVAVNPYPNISAGEAQGTAVAGIIAGAADNGLGGVGVAHGASITGVNIFNPSTFGYIDGSITNFLSVVGQAAQKFDIAVNSWANQPLYLASQNLGDPTSKAGRLDAQYALLSANGRGGLGTIVVQAAGDNIAVGDN